jgi:hypothetical protein
MPPPKGGPPSSTPCAHVNDGQVAGIRGQSSGGRPSSTRSTPYLGAVKTAATVSLSIENGVSRFYCLFCAAPVFDDDDGVAEVLCKHVKVFVDWIGEPS